METFPQQKSPEARVLVEDLIAEGEKEDRSAERGKFSTEVSLSLQLSLMERMLPEQLRALFKADREKFESGQSYSSFADDVINKYHDKFFAQDFDDFCKNVASEESLERMSKGELGEEELEALAAFCKGKHGPLFTDEEVKDLGKKYLH